MIKAVLLFIPLLAAFVGLFIGIHDLKHPALRSDQCRLVGRGLSVQGFKADATTLYTSSGRTEDDIAFQCRMLGKAVVNDRLPLPVYPGQVVHLTIRDYRYFPSQYRLSIFQQQAKALKPTPST